MLQSLKRERLSKLCVFVLLCEGCIFVFWIGGCDSGGEMLCLLKKLSFSPGSPLKNRTSYPHLLSVYTHTWEPRHVLTRTSVHRNILARKLRQSLRGRHKYFVFSPCERHDDKAAGRKLACAKIFEEWCRAGG